MTGSPSSTRPSNFPFLEEWAVVLLCAASAACSSDLEPEAAPEQTNEIDNDGDGVADELGRAVMSDDPAYAGRLAVDRDGDGLPDAAGLDTDGDGIVDALDTNLDGLPDILLGGTNPAPASGGSGSEIILDGSVPVPGATPMGTPETCDGIDNDLNGIADDVDAGGDGICDCLRIGTLGSIGPWSDGGNIFRTWLNERSSTPAVELGHAPFTAATLDSLDILVVLRVDQSELAQNDVTDPAHHAFSADEIAVFNAWVRAGGGALSTLGYTGDETAEMVNVNSLLSLASPGYSSDTNLEGFISDWRVHPISDGVSLINNSNGVVADDTSGEVVAVDDGGRPALVAHQVDSGRVIVWGDEWITYDSEWVGAEEQQVELLWLNMLKWLSPPQTCQVPIPEVVR